MRRRRAVIAAIALALASPLAGCGAASRSAAVTPSATASPSVSPLSRPTLYDRAITVAFGDYSIVGYDAASGAQTLHYGGGGTGKLAFDSTPTFAGGLAYAGGYVIPPPCPGLSSSCSGVASGLYALDLASGSVRWQAVTDGPVEEPPVAVDGVVFAATTAPFGHSVYAFDAQSGAQRWRFQANGGIKGPAVVANGTVYISSDYIYALRADTGALLWRTAAPAGFFSVADGVIYAESSLGVTALRASDGQVLWQTPTGYPPDTRPVVADGSVYVSSGVSQTDARACLCALDARTGAMRWRYLVGGALDTPAYADGTVYVGGWDNHLDALDAQTGALRWRFDATSFLVDDPTAQQWAKQHNGVDVQSPLVRDGVVYFAASYSDYRLLYGPIYAIEVDTHALRWVTQPLSHPGSTLVLAP